MKFRAQNVQNTYKTFLFGVWTVFIDKNLTNSNVLSMLIANNDKLLDHLHTQSKVDILMPWLSRVLHVLVWKKCFECWSMWRDVTLGYMYRCSAYQHKRLFTCIGKTMQYLRFVFDKLTRKIRRKKLKKWNWALGMNVKWKSVDYSKLYSWIQLQSLYSFVVRLLMKFLLCLSKPIFKLLSLSPKNHEWSENGDTLLKWDAI